jgi:hypothetical protein
MRPSHAAPSPRPARRLRRAWLLAALLIALPGLAQAWGKPAHRLVAGLAEAQLRPSARAEATRLLATEGAAHLAEVSGWADEVRKAGGERARDTRRWHFVNFDRDSCEYAPARDCPDGDCIVAAINRQFLRLADRQLPDAERAEALKFLVHLVADVHQPLHATPRSLRGGLDFQVEWRGKGRNLHLLWDLSVLDRALEASSLDEAGYLRYLQAQPALPADPTRRSDRRAADWAQESCRVIAGDAITPRRHAISDAWLDARRARMDRQLRVAGARLADMLNFALDPARTATTR